MHTFTREMLSSLHWLLHSVTQLCCISTLYFLIVNTVVAVEEESKPKCLLFIGPHKTGSTSLQSFFHKHQDQLEQDGYHWVTVGSTQSKAPGGSVHYPLAVSFQWTFPHFNAHVAALKYDIAKSRAAGKSIILAAEDFSTLTLPQAQVLRKCLKGFRVTVVFVYRAWVAKLISHFNQYAKEQNIQEVTFRDWLFQIMAGSKWHVPDRVHDFWGVLGIYSDVFGQENVKILDYYGMMATGARLDVVIMCEVLGNKICERSQKVHEIRNNPSQPVIWNQFIQLLNEFAFHYRGVKLTLEGERVAVLHEHGVLRNYQWPARPLPLIRSDILYLRQYSLMLDEMIRKTYADNIMYSNRSANAYAISITKLNDIDADRIRTDQRWRDAMAAAIDTTLNSTQLVTEAAAPNHKQGALWVAAL